MHKKSISIIIALGLVLVFSAFCGCITESSQAKSVVLTANTKLVNCDLDGAQNQYSDAYYNKNKVRFDARREFCSLPDAKFVFSDFGFINESKLGDGTYTESFDYCFMMITNNTIAGASCARTHMNISPIQNKWLITNAYSEQK